MMLKATLREEESLEICFVIQHEICYRYVCLTKCWRLGYAGKCCQLLGMGVKRGYLKGKNINYNLLEIKYLRRYSEERTTK